MNFWIYLDFKGIFGGKQTLFGKTEVYLKTYPHMGFQIRNFTVSLGMIEYLEICVIMVDAIQKTQKYLILGPGASCASST